MLRVFVLRKADVVLIVLFLIAIVIGATSLYYALNLADAIGNLGGKIEGVETGIKGLDSKVSDLWKEVFGKPPVKPPPLEGQILRIGLVLPLTGPQAPFGLRAKWGSEWAAEKINEAGGILGAKIQLFVEDNAGDPKVTVSAVEKLITVDKCQVIRVSHLSGCILAGMEVTEKYEIPLVTICGAADDITRKGYKYIFRIGPNGTIACLDDIAFMKEYIKPKRVAIIHDPAVYAVQVRDAFIQLTEKLKPGWEIVSIESYPAGTVDFRPLLMKVKEAKPDYLYVLPFITEGALIVKQFRELGFEIPMQVSAACNVLDYLRLVGRDGLGIFVAVEYWSDIQYPDPKVIREMAVECWNRYKAALDKDFIAAYVGTYVIAKAVELAQSLDPKKIADALRQVRIDLPYYGKDLHFYPNGQFTWNMYMGQIQWARPDEPWNVDGLTFHIVYPPPCNSTVPIMGLKP